MRYSNDTVIFASANATTNGNAVDARQILCVSGQCVASDAAGGTMKLQVSNDQFGAVNAGGISNPVNWADVTNATVSVNAAGVFYIQKTEICAEYVRLVYTDTTALVQTVTVVADVSGSLNSKYFLLSSPTVNYYVWFNINSAGVDPALAGKTGIEVAAATSASANTIAVAMASAIDGLAAFVAPVPGAAIVTITNAVAGPATPASEGAAPTGFTFAVTAPLGTITAVLDSKSF